MTNQNNGGAKQQYQKKQGNSNYNGLQMSNTSGNEFGNWEAPAGHNPKMHQNKLKNVPTGTTGGLKAMSLNASAFQPFTPGQSDPVTTNLKKFCVEDKEEVKLYKEYLVDLKKCIDSSKGVISLDLFKKIGNLKLCNAKTDLGKCMNAAYVKREAENLEPTFRSNKPGKPNRNNARGNQGGGNDFAMGTQKQYNNRRDPTAGGWNKADSEEFTALKAKAKEYQNKLANNTKTETQKLISKVRLILNVIAPDNKEKKMRELRAILFGDLKTKDECEDEEIEYNEEEHKLIGEGEGKVDQTILETIVQNIIRKAQVEKEYCIFYGEICQEEIQLELALRGEANKRENMKQSLFRKQLFNVCKVEFEKFFDEEELKKSKKDKESEILFKVKLFGNIEFLGELYRRKLLPQTTLISVFQSLLGISEVNEEVNDLVIEGAINLMNKVGEDFEKNISSAKKVKDDVKKSFEAITARFKWAQEKEEAPISNRIKLLIKNMFQNRDDGWKKTQEMHKGGPKTKAEVQKEVEDKYKNEEKARQ